MQVLRTFPSIFLLSPFISHHHRL